MDEQDIFKGKTLLITGGTGSFGNAVLRRFLHSGVAQIRVFSRDEKKQEDMRIALKSDKVQFHIGDVRDISSVDLAMRDVDFVFHAAALKQVPSCEFHPMEAVRTNVLGADNVLSSAIKHKVSRVVVLSTDKAVYPINAMGLSKGLMEKVAISRSRGLTMDDTVICATRYGNVMASRGSVIPLFLQQIANGGPITVTDPEMTRFMMSLDESVDLVIFAFRSAMQGDIFVQKSPAATIAQLAAALKTIAGRPEIETRIIGTRHGEKLFEVLVSREEMARAVDLDRYYRIPADGRDLNYGKYFTSGEIEVSEATDYTSHNTHRLDASALEKILRDLPEVRETIS